MSTPGISRTADGFEVRIVRDERAVLADLPEFLRAVVEGEVRPDLGERLFPPASDEPEIEQAYRDLVDDDLREQRLAAVDRFAATLAAGRPQRRLWVVHLDDEEAQAWLSTLNDLRLVLAPLAGVVSEEAWDAGPDADSPESVLLYHLSWLQEELLTALMSSLPQE